RSREALGAPDQLTVRAAGARFRRARGRSHGARVRGPEARMNPRVLVVIPAHDEQASLPGTLAEVRTRAPWGDILVVGVGSRDDTSRVARAAGVTAVRHPVNRGVGGALQTGFRWAWRHGYDIVVQLDADGQHDPAYLEPLLAPILAGHCDVSIGSRFVSST